MYGGEKMSRVIENKIITAIKAGKTGIYNLSKRDKLQIKENKSYDLYLWNNLIFSFDSETQSQSFSMCGYNTTTTKNRLNAILNTFDFHIFQKNGQLYIVDKENNKETKINVCKTYVINVLKEIKEKQDNVKPKKDLIEECKKELLTCFSEDKEESLKEIKRYKKDYPNAIDYNIYEYGNIRAYYSDIEDFFKSCGIQTDYKDNDLFIKTYKQIIRRAVDSILKENK